MRPDTQGFGASAEKGVLGSITSIAKKAAIAFGGIFAAQQGVAFFKGAIEGASDLNESMSKVEVVFGSSADEIKKFAANSATALGQSKQQALEAAGTFGNLAVSLGVPQEKAADMSKSLVQLGADLASFNNTSVDDALTALRSGLSGETEPLKRFGVAIDDATLKQKALALGLIDTTSGVLPPAIRAQAAYALIMDRTKTAQGDFARTSDGLANKQRILSARLTDLKTTIGKALLPVMSGAVSLIIDKGIPAFEGLGRAIAPVARTVSLGVRAFAAAFSGEGVTSDGFVGQMERIGVTARKVYEKAIKPLGEFIEAHLKPILIGLAVAISPLPVTLVLLYSKFQIVRDGVALVVDAFKFLIGQVENLVAAFSERFGAIQEAVGHVLKAITVLVAVALAPIVAAWRLFGDQILQIVGVAFDQVRAVIETAVRIIRDVIDVVLALINGDWGDAWNALKDIPAAVLGLVVDTVTNAMRIMVIEITRGVELAVGLIGSLPGRFLGLVGGILSAASKIGSAIMDGIGHGLSAATGFAADVAGAVVRALKSLINRQVIDRINDGIPDSLGAGPFRISLPKNPIPRLAGGALVTARPGGIIANIAEGRNDEGVLPLPPGVIEGLQAIAANARSGGRSGPFRDLVIQGATVDAADRTAVAVVREMRAEAYRQGA